MKMAIPEKTLTTCSTSWWQASHIQDERLWVPWVGGIPSTGVLRTSLYSARPVHRLIASAALLLCILQNAKLGQYLAYGAGIGRGIRLFDRP